MATTWTQLSARSAKAACTTGSESAPTLVTQGVALDGTGCFSVHVSADTLITGAGTLQAYLWNDVVGEWSRSPDLDLSVTATSVKANGFPGIRIDGPRGRLAYLPNGLTFTGTNLTVYILGTFRGPMGEAA